MPVSTADVGLVVGICARQRHRVCYGVLGAALSTRAGNADARPGNYGVATGGMVSRCFGGMGPVASWAVAVNGYPTGYGNPPNSNYDPTWSTQTPLHTDVEEFLEWLDQVSPGWDGGLQSSHP